MPRDLRGPLLVACPRCGAPVGERCVDLELHPFGWRKGARRVLFAHPARRDAADPRFVTQEGFRLHRLAAEYVDGTLRARCGVRSSDGHKVEHGDALRHRLEDCGNCARAGL